MSRLGDGGSINSILTSSVSEGHGESEILADTARLSRVFVWDAGSYGQEEIGRAVLEEASKFEEEGRQWLRSTHIQAADGKE